MLNFIDAYLFIYMYSSIGFLNYYRKYGNLMMMILRHVDFDYCRILLRSFISNVYHTSILTNDKVYYLASF